MRSRSAAAALCASLLFLSAARADNFEEFGFGARAQGMAGASTALASDYAATYYNPGGLILSRHLNLSAGFSFADYQLRFDSQRGGDRLDRGAERIPDLSAFTLGISKTIPVDVPDRLAFGLGLFLPTRGIVNLNSNADAGIPEWFRYGERQDRIHVLPAFAVKVTDWLSFGAGGSVFVDGTGRTTISAGVTSPVQPEFRLKLKPDAGAVVGALLQPAPWLSFGVTYRSEISFKLDFPAEALVQGISIPLRLETITFFTPHQVQVGAAVNLTDRLLLALDLGWSQWSAYDDAFLVVSSPVAAVPQRVSAGLDDVYSVRLGAEGQVTDLLALRGGYAFRSSTTGSQPGPTNLVDTEKHVFTVGAGFSWGQEPDRPLDPATEGPVAARTADDLMRQSSFDLDLFVQVHWHPERSQSKPATDPVGDWEAGGTIVNFGFGFTARF